MTTRRRSRTLAVIASCAVATLSGCGFNGLNSLPLPGAVGRSPDANVYHIQFANVGTLEPNSPVMIDDVVVGSVRQMTFSNWHIDVEVSVKPDVVVPANAEASVGQTSLLGSMHIALDPRSANRPPEGSIPERPFNSTKPRPTRRPNRPWRR